MRRERIERSSGGMRAFRVAYDGRRFRGFQRQPDVSTVEDALFDALEGLDAFERDGPGPNRPPGYAAAGRTDAGVSAVAQTIAFACPDWLTPRAFNSELPASVRIWADADVGVDFHATHDAVGREYTYCLYAPRDGNRSGDCGAADADRPSPRRPQIDDERVQSALTALSGHHDFHNFTPEATGTVREVTATAERGGEFLLLRVAADGFPREFVRRLVTLLRDVGTGAAEPAFAERALGSAPLTGADGIGPAPAEPLVLTGVSYPDCSFERDEGSFERDEGSFERDENATASARAVFGDRRATALTNARVAGLVRELVGDGEA